MRATSKFATATAVVATALLTACGGGDDTDKAGGAGGVTTLEVGTPDRPDRPGSDALERIADDVASRSEGRLRLRIVHESQTRVGPRNAADADQVVAEQVRKGDLDMAMVPSRAWDVLGVTSLQALQTPFLITTDDLLGQVVGGKLGDEMLEGVEQAGVVALGLHAEGLRHPIGYEQRLTKLGDFDGQQIEARQSQASYALLRALGAEPVWYADDDEFEQALAERRVVGTESSFTLSGTLGVDQPVVTGNVTLFPKVNVLVGNEKALGELTDEDREILKTAAEAERERSIDALSETGAAAESCARGVRAVNARPADVAALREAARPVEEKLRADEQTARLIDAISELDSPPPSDPKPCEGALLPDVEDQVVLRGPTGKLPLGIYRLRVTDEELAGRGLDEDTILYNAGLFTLDVKDDGTWDLNQRPAHDIDTPTDWGGDFSVKGNRVTTTVQTLEEAKGFRDVYRWSFAGGELELRPVRSSVVEPNWNGLGGAWLAGLPWRKIG